MKINFEFKTISELRSLRLLLKIKLTDLEQYISKYDNENKHIDNLSFDQEQEINESLNQTLIEILTTPESSEKLNYVESIDNYDYQNFDLSKHLKK